MPSISRSAQHTSPTRPSISPLSTTSRNLKPSPIASRDALLNDNGVHDHDDVDDTSDLGDAETGEQHDDHSSSLSEPDDDNEDAEDEDVATENTPNGDDAAAQQLMDDDSEAETERLELTPQKLQKPNDTGRTPSKLNQTTTALDELSEPPSPLATGAGAASSTSTVATVSGQKRKRSETADSSLTSADSDIGESPRKKSHEMSAHPMDEIEDPLEHVEPSTESAEHAEDTPAADDARDTPIIQAKVGKGRGGRKKKHREPAEEQEAHVAEDPIEPEEEPSEEKVARTEEEIKAKKEASSAYDDLTKQFRFFREKLNTEQLASLNAELSLLNPSKCTHPEYLKQVACVDARLQKQRSEAHAFKNYQFRSIRERSLGERSQLHSQYYQTVREVREEVLYKLGEDWHAIQKERRQSHQEQDDAHIFRFPTDKRVQKRNQAKYNQEVSVLSGVAKWVGFPAAPDTNGVDGDTFEDDMKAMKVSCAIGLL